MTSSGETDLAALLRGMSPELHDGDFVFSSVPGKVPPRANPIAFVREEEGITLVLPRREADELGLPYDYVAAWITLRIHSSLEAVGLTAAVSRVLADAGISANVVSGVRHDHLFVPFTRARDALRTLRTLSASQGLDGTFAG